MSTTSANSTPIDHAAMLVERYFGSRDGELTVGGVRIKEIVATHGSPVYVYDRAILDHQLNLLRETLPARFEVFYSVKANPNQSFLRYFVDHGCGLEVASGGELYQALAAECPADRVVFAGPGKTDEELALAVSHEIREVHVESLSEIRRLDAIAESHGQRVQVSIRVNAASSVQGGAMRMGGKPSPFGFDEERLEEAIESVGGSAHLELAGLHLYLGTQILDANVLVKQYRHATELARRAAQHSGSPLRNLDFGGGFGVPYFAHESPLDLSVFAQGLAQLAEEIENDPWLSETTLVVEPGRFLVGSSGIYVSRVLDVKESRGKTFVVLDGGMHHHLAASGNLGQTIKRNFPLAVLNKLNDEIQETVDVVGPLCTPLDTLARSVSLPQIEPGDLVGIFQSGAYARTSSPWGFLSHPSPPEVLVEDEHVRLIRRRSALADLLHDQVVASPMVAQDTMEETL